MKHKEEQVYEWLYKEESGQRLDKFLALEKKAWSRSQIQQWIKAGQVLVNGRAIKPNYKLQVDDQIILKITPPQEMDIQSEQMDLDVYYEDQDMIVINKPRGLVVHPAPGHYTGTLVNGLLAHCQDLSGINGVLRPGIVHRIDMDTSGLLMVAKNDKTHLSLAEQLKKHLVTRRYVAIVHGYLRHDKGTIEAPIGRDPQNRKRMAVVSTGKEAMTHFRVLERFDHSFSLVELQLQTGRTHQIRVHMKYIGHPVAGDPKYGPSKSLTIDGQALHAQFLEFVHPGTGKRLQFEAPIPEDMQLEINRLKR